MYNTIDNNYKAMQGTFLYYLHEKNEFNIKSFWDLYDGIVELGKSNRNENLNFEIIRKLNFVYKNILEYFVFHMDSNDLYKIKGFPHEDYTLYLERLDTAVDAFLGGYEINDEIFELKRPK